MNSKVPGYDYIIAGAGTAGCVIAARLSETGTARVLLLEAGGSEPLPAMAVPPAWPTLWGSSADWGGTSVEQAGTGSTVALPRGRGLGGSSSINGMIFLRGQRSSYDAWQAAGAMGWGYADLLPFFQRSEHTVGRDPAVRGTGGPMEVAPAARPNPVAAACLQAAVEVGHRRAADISSGLEEGAGWHDLTIVGGVRQSAADAYLRPALERPNLDVVTGALVHRVRLEADRCVGVDYSVGRETVSVDCVREVVLTAGTIGSAQVLMLSGIGPAEHLRDVGLDVVLDLPGVGSNLHDHPMSGIVYSARQPIPTSVNNHGEASAVLRSDPSLESTDLQTLFASVPYHHPALHGPTDGYTIAVGLMAPRSRGSVRLTSPEPDAAPRVDPNYLDDPRDAAALVTGLRLAREIGQADALAPWRGQEVLPGPGTADDDGLRAYLRKSLITYFHYVGTCRFGDDATAVVDSNLRVRGITGLRVADASVMPSIISANTNATVLAIAERAASLIETA